MTDPSAVVLVRHAALAAPLEDPSPDAGSDADAGGSDGGDSPTGESTSEEEGSEHGSGEVAAESESESSESDRQTSPEPDRGRTPDDAQDAAPTTPTTTTGSGPAPAGHAARDQSARAARDAVRQARDRVREAQDTVRELQGAVRDSAGARDRTVVLPAPDGSTAATTSVSAPATARVTPARRVADALTESVVSRVALALAGVTPDVASGPLAPAAPSSALLLAQWALFRRGESLFNRSPVASAAPPAPTTGLITGAISATDPDGDALAYELGDAPARGTVVVHDDGTYTYTPGDDLARAGGDDHFTVVVHDDGPAAPGAGRLTTVLHDALARTRPELADRLFGAHAVTVTVDVHVPAAATGPTLPTTPPAPTVDARGTVSGNLGIVASGGGRLTFEVPEQPARGTVTVDEHGGYVYVPSAAAQIAAARTPGRDYDTFTVIVREGRAASRSGMHTLGESTHGPKDGSGTETVVTRTVEITPAATTAPTVVGTVPVAPNPGPFQRSPDRRWAAVASYAENSTTTITLLDTRERSTKVIYTGSNFGDVAFSPDGSQVYISDFYGTTVTVVGTEDGATLAILPAGAHPSRVQFSPDGRRAYVTSSEDATVTVIDTATRTVVASAPASRYGYPLVFSPDGRRAYVGSYSGDTMIVIDTETDRVTTIAVGPEPRDPVFGPDGLRAYVVSPRAGTVTIVDTVDDSVVATLAVTGQPGTVQFDADGRRAYVTGYGSGTLTVIDTATGAVVGTVAAGSDPELQFTPDHRHGYVVDGTRLLVIDPRDDSVTVVPLATRAGEIRFSRDSSRAVVRSADGDETLTVIDTATGTVVGTAHVGGSTGSLQFGPDGTRAYLQRFEGEGATVVVVDTANGAILAETPVAVRGGETIFSPDGGRLYIGYRRGGFVAIDTATNQVTTTVQVPVGKKALGSPRFSPDGRYVYFRAGRGDAQRLVLISTLDDQVTTLDLATDDLVFSEDGRYAYADDPRSGTIVVIDVGDGLPGEVEATPVTDEDVAAAA